MKPKAEKGVFSGYQLGNLYTLRSMAQDLGVSTGLIYKIETIFGFREWSSRRRGKKSEYSEAQKNFFLKVICLNSQFFGNLPDIKALFELEKKIDRVAKEHLSVSERNAQASGIIKVFLIAGLYCPQEGIPYDKVKYEKNHAAAKRLSDLYKEYTELFKNIADTTHKRQEILKTQMNRIDEIAAGKI